MEIIGQIYEALDDDEVFNALPRFIADHVGARSCTIQSISPQFHLEDLLYCYFTDEMNTFYAENNFHHFDHWTPPIDSPENWGQAIRSSEFLGEAEFRKGIFYNEFIRKFGDDSFYCLGFAQTLSDGGRVLTGVHHAEGATDFDNEQVGKLESLRPHIMRLMELRRRLSATQTKAMGALVGIDSIEDGCLVISSDRRIIFSNSTAEELLNDASLLKPIAGKLFLNRALDDDQLKKAIEDTIANRIEGRSSFLARDQHGHPWRMMLAPKTFHRETMLLVWVDRCEASASAPAAMQQLYGLTQAELPILMAVSQGESAAEISDRQEISIATVRSHIQHIYQKTGVHKASQLTQIVASLPRIK